MINGPEMPETVVEKLQPDRGVDPFTGRNSSRPRGRPKRLAPCPYCGRQMGSHALRYHLPKCSLRAKSPRLHPISRSRDHFIQALHTLSHMPCPPDIWVGLGYLNARDKTEPVIDAAFEWFAEFYRLWKQGDPCQDLYESSDPV